MNTLNNQSYLSQRQHSNEFLRDNHPELLNQDNNGKFLFDQTATSGQALYH